MAARPARISLAVAETIAPGAGAPEKLSTKDKILDAAEELFASLGYFGVSLRDITRLAGVELALANYHFGPKEELFRHVIARRADIHCNSIIESLDAAFVEAGDRPPAVETIIDAFVHPVFSRLMTGEPGWHNYIRLLAQVSQLRHQQDFLRPLHTLYNPVVRKFLSSVQASLPACKEENVYWAYYFFWGSLLHILTANGDIDKVSHGMCQAADYRRIREWLVPFMSAGIYRIVNQ